VRVTVATAAGLSKELSDEITIGEIGATITEDGLRAEGDFAGKKVWSKRDIASAATFVSEETWTNSN